MSRALDFARFFIEGPESTVTQVNMDRTILSYKIVTSMMNFLIKPQFGGKINYYNKEKEEKAKLIIGEKLQVESQKSRLIDAVV